MQRFSEENSTIVCPESPDANCWCLHGAIIKCYGRQNDEASEARTKLYKAIEETYGRNSIAMFNDDKRTTFEDIQKIIKEANI
jgi:hypothetical protein